MTALAPADESGLWRFGDSDTLRNLLSIDSLCLGRNSSTLSRCKNRLGSTKISQIEHTLPLIAGQSLHCDTAATYLGDLVRACLCSTHVKANLATGYGKDLNIVPYTDYIRHSWDRRLWAVCLEEQGIPRDLAWGSPPSLNDVQLWEARTSFMRTLPVPAWLRRFSFSEKDDTLPVGDATGVRNSTSSHATDILGLRLRRTFSDLGSLGSFKRKGIRFWRTKPTTPQPPPPVKPALERNDGTRNVPTLHTVAPSEDPVTPVKRRRHLERAAKMPIRYFPPEPLSPSLISPAAHDDSSSDRYGLSRDDASPSPPPSAVSSVFSLGSDDGLTPETKYTMDDKYKAGRKVFAGASEGAVDYGNPLEDSPLHRKSASVPLHCNTGSTKKALFGRSTGAETRPDSSQSETASIGFFSTHSQLDSNEAPETPDDSDEDSTYHLEASEEATTRPGTRIQPGAGAKESGLGPAQVDSAHRDFAPRKDIDQYTSLANILNRLECQVLSTKRGPGYIYIYEREGATGYIKIGSAADPVARVRRWASQCKYDGNTLETELMSSVPVVMEKCIHDHLYQYRQDDLWCVKARAEESSGGGTTLPRKPAKGCRTTHKEWFKVGLDEAKRVIDLWARFNRTSPFDRGRINSFWRDYVISLDGKMPGWRDAGEPALERWESIMEEGMERWETEGFNDPLAEIKLVFRARNDGRDHVIEILDPRKDGQPPLVATPLRLRRQQVNG